MALEPLIYQLSKTNKHKYMAYDRLNGNGSSAKISTKKERSDLPQDYPAI